MSAAYLFRCLLIIRVGKAIAETPHGLNKIGFHFLEEVGEVAEELSRKNQNREMCKDEIADVFAWLVALTERVNKLFDGYSIEDGIYTMYPGSCKACGGNPCSCPDDEDDKK